MIQSAPKYLGVEYMLVLIHVHAAQKAETDSFKNPTTSRNHSTKWVNYLLAHLVREVLFYVIRSNSFTFNAVQIQHFGFGIDIDCSWTHISMKRL